MNSRFELRSSANTSTTTRPFSDVWAGRLSVEAMSNMSPTRIAVAQRSFRMNIRTILQMLIRQCEQVIHRGAYAPHNRVGDRWEHSDVARAAQDLERNLPLLDGRRSPLWAFLTAVLICGCFVIDRSWRAPSWQSVGQRQRGSHVSIESRH